MKKQDLERRNKFLLLQLKIISETLRDEVIHHDGDALWKAIGKIDFLTDPIEIKKSLANIEEYDVDYNFYNKDMNIDDYE